MFLTCVSLAIWLVFIMAMWSGSDRIAALLLLPVWLVTVTAVTPALIAWLWAREWFAFGTVILWTLTAIMVSDVFQGIGRIGLDQDPVHMANERLAWRIVSIDCRNGSSVPAEILRPIHPDVIFLQNLQHIDHAQDLAVDLFGANPSIRTSGNNAIIVRHGQLAQAWPVADNGSFIVDWSPDRTVVPVRLVNVNLSPSPENKNLFSADCWKAHAETRAKHRQEIDTLLDALKNMGRRAGEIPVICAGAFYSPPQSPVFDSFLRVMTDAYGSSGVGYGATCPADFPILRLHRIGYTSPLRSIHSSTLYIPGLSAYAVMADIKSL